MSDDHRSGAAADEVLPPSKTQRKNAMHDLQLLGKSLVALDPRRLAEFDLPERLADAIIAARTITRHEARRRQMQYIGRLMRDVDPAPIAASLARLDEMPHAEKLRFAALERWRDRLMDDDAALDDYAAAHPHASKTELAVLIRTARAERAAGAPPHKFRQLFRRLKDLGEAAPATVPGSGT
jgi:ribosome-associated protein